MSEKDKIYTELEMMTCSRSDNVYDVPAPVIRDLGATLGSSNSKPICPGKSKKVTSCSNHCQLLAHDHHWCYRFILGSRTSW